MARPLEQEPRGARSEGGTGGAAARIPRSAELWAETPVPEVGRDPRGHGKLDLPGIGGRYLGRHPRPDGVQAGPRILRDPQTPKTPLALLVAMLLMIYTTRR